MSGDEPMLSIERISASYGPIQALNQVSLKVCKGDIVTLIGSNGAGKSTLLMSVFGQPKINAGKIIFENTDISGLPTHVISRLGIAVVPEGRRIFPKMSVLENLLMGTVPTGGNGKDSDLDQVFQRFPKLKERSSQLGGTLSGGEQQMLAIGRALMSQPKLLLLDEPSLGLAPLIVKDIFAILGDIATAGTTIFLVEQNASQALRLANRGYVLVNGEIKLSGNGQELLNNPQVREAYLGGH